MNKTKAIEILTEMNRWRQAKNPYNKPNTLPYKPSEFTEAIDFAIKSLSAGEKKENEMNPFRARLIRCITPNSKCSLPRDPSEDRAWEKVEKWVTQDQVRSIEVFYAADKSPEGDETWKRKHGTTALFNQLREQIDLAESFIEKSKPKPKKDKGPDGWEKVAQEIASDTQCPANLRKTMTLAKTWADIPPQAQSIIWEKLA